MDLAPEPWGTVIAFPLGPLGLALLPPDVGRDSGRGGEAPRIHTWDGGSRLPTHWSTARGPGVALILIGHLDEPGEIQALACPSGDVTQTPNDAALALAAWLGEGEAGLSRLRGPFALALADLRGAEGPRLLCLREPLGRRGLFYCRLGQSVYLAEEPATLLNLPGVSRAPDEHWLAVHFSLIPPRDGRTPFRAIQKLLPGERLGADRDGLRTRRESLRLGNQRLHGLRDADYVRELRRLLSQAVRRCLRGTGALTGVMLSGGMDSGPLAALAQGHLRGQGRTLRAYSWTLPSLPEADEGPQIRACAGHLSCGLRLIPGDQEWPLRDLAHWPVDPSTPLANAFRRLKLQIYRAAAAEGCRVILNGAAGDALYPPPGQGLLECLHTGRLGPLIHALVGVVRRGGGAPWRDPALQRLVRRLRPWAQAQMAGPPPWLGPCARAHWEAPRGPWPPESRWHPRPEQYRAALGQWAADGLCDEAFFTSRCGIERRDPFRDLNLIDFMLSIPAQLFERDGHDKWITRQAMANDLPENIRWRPRGGLLTRFFDGGFLREREAIEALLWARHAAWPDYVARPWVEEALEAREPTGRQRLLIWYCAAFELWRRALSGEHPELLAFAEGKCRGGPVGGKDGCAPRDMLIERNQSAVA